VIGERPAMRSVVLVLSAFTLCACGGSRLQFDLAAPTAVCGDGTFSYAPRSERQCAGADGVRLSLDGDRHRRPPR
jgi:hypothetical protein